MIWFFKPYSLDKDIGKAYNEYCSLVPDGDWICLLDGDTQFLTSDYGHLCQKYIDAFPECELFVPYVNRIGKRSQCYNRIISENPDIKYHKKIADKIKHFTTVKDISRDPHLSISMPMFLFSKKLWAETGGFDETERILGVDVRFSEKARKRTRIYLMEGFYLFHYYRLMEGAQSKDHLLGVTPSATVCINLPEATERWKRASKQFEREGLTVIRIDGEPGGHKGCTLAHKKVLEMARENNWESVLIFEDDVVLERDFKNKLKKFVTDAPSDWNMLYLGGNHAGGNLVRGVAHRVKQITTTHALIIHKSMYDVLLEDIDNHDIPIDRYYMKFQPKYRVFVCRPHLAWQADGWSYTQSKEVKVEMLTKTFGVKKTTTFR